MTTIRIHSRSLLISAALAASTSLLSLGAHAGIVYNGYADIEYCLNSVTSVTGSNNGNNPGACQSNGCGSGNGSGSGSQGWSVSSSSDIYDLNASSSGSGVASTDSMIGAATNWSLGDSFIQTSESYGGASGNGSADSFIESEFFISFTNNLNTPLSFEFLFSSFVSADIDVNGSLGTNDDSSSYAEISLFDKDMDELFFSSAEAFIGGDLISSETNDNQSLRVNLQGKESNEIYGIVYSDGYAESVRESVSVPEPSIIWLMTLGLFGLLTQKTRQRSNNHIKNMM